MNTQLLVTALMLGATISPATTDSAPEGPDRRRLKNMPPVCVLAEIATITCQGDITTVQLDASGSYDPDGDDLTYLWTSCPNSTIDDPFAAITTLRINTAGFCDQTCGVRFQVSDGQANSGCRQHLEVEAQTGPHFDIKPGSCPNPINVSNYAEAWEAKVAGSLLGNDFDVTQANVSTIKLRRRGLGDMMFGGGVAVFPVQNNMSDTGTPYLGGGDCGCHAVGADGLTDLDLKFFKIDIIEAFQLTLEENDTYIELELSGELLDGTPFTAIDCIRVLNNG